MIKVKVTVSKRDKQQLRTGVALGCLLLDERWTGEKPWRELINIEKLNMSSPRSCILGQLYGDYFNGHQTLGVEFFNNFGFNLNNRMIQETEKLARDQSISIAETYRDARWKYFTKLWKKMLTKGVKAV